MSAPSKADTFQLVKIQPEERLAITSEQNPAPGWVTGHREARGTGYRAATQVKGWSPEITIVSEADAVHGSGRQQTADRYWQGQPNPTGSETAARYQREGIGTREAHGIPCRRVGGDKPINGKESPMMPWESDQFIVARKPRNGGGAKGLAARPKEEGNILQTLNWGRDVNGTLSMTPAWLGKVWPKSRMWEIHKSGSVRGLIVAPDEMIYFRRRWL
jgi:hypothetical protein